MRLHHHPTPMRKTLASWITFCALATVASLLSCRAPADSSVQTVDRLISHPFATPISLHGDPKRRQITSLEISIPGAVSKGELILNETKLVFDEFGIAKPLDEQTETLQIQFQKPEIEKSRWRVAEHQVQQRADRKLYEVKLPTKLECKIYLVLAKPLNDSRLVITDGRQATNVIELTVDRETADKAVPQEIEELDLSSTLVATERGLVNFRIQGELGGTARFHLDPNDTHYSQFGLPMASTLLGWSPRLVEINHVKTQSKTGWELYEIVNDSPRLVQYFLVISKRDGQHRLVIRDGQTIKHVVPMRAT